MDKQLYTKRCRLIHYGLHKPKVTNIVIAGEKFPVKTGRNGMRYVTWEGGTFIQADPRKSSYIRSLVDSGRCATWIMRAGGKRWGLIVDNKIVRP